ncbi:DUF6266 family protein [Pedobacter sp.]|jgi:hypothetical protein|uniref:DUF6266 family protein n=1 Tax=Pedobacter sp. TaxID=1411316 RepID=UPI002BC6E922|nr:DUF6266 family protein [Pedobacter sp.]HWW40457.1 DUF6266 family protein [Pedobacter sp.]
MGRYKNGINGNVSGKIGSVIGSSWKGVPYLKGLHNLSSVPPTEAQLNQRLKLSIVSSWLRPLLSWINIGYQHSVEEKTAMNAAVSYHMKEALVGEGPDFSIDFSKAIFSRGELLISWVKNVFLLLNASVHVVWSNGPLSAFCGASDLANFIVYNSTKGKFLGFKDAAFRSSKEALLRLPVGFVDDVLYGWMHFVSEDGGRVSTSVYLGKIG